ncbi:MAG: hypothetical protein ABIK27_06365 [Bacteroidota bacterium]
MPRSIISGAVCSSELGGKPTLSNLITPYNSVAIVVWTVNVLQNVGRPQDFP